MVENVRRGSLRSLEDSFRAQVRDIATEFNYSNEGEAFIHLAVKLIFDLDDPEAIEACEIGKGGHDWGIDAVHRDESDTLFIIQGKYGRKTGRNIRDDLQTALSLLGGQVTPRQQLRLSLARAVSLYREYVKRGKRVVLMPVVFGEITPQARELLREFSLSLPKNHELQIKEKEQLLELYSHSLEVYTGKGFDGKFNIEKYYYVEGGENLPRAIVCTVPGEEVVRLVAEGGFDIFQLNVREYLGRNPVNQDILQTLQDENERKFFWYYNLGLSAVCDHFDVKNNQIEVRNLRIVNGCQTANILYRNSSYVGPSVKVPMRIIEANDEELALNITIRNNRQTSIRGRDLFSQHRRQKELQEEFASLTPPFFYERRRGEWKSLPQARKERFLIRTRRPGRREARLINNELAGKAQLAVRLGLPAEAKMRKRDIFKEEGQGGFYEKIFSASAEELLLSWYIYSEVYRRVRDSVKREDLRNRYPFLAHADTQIAALIGLLLERRYSKGLPFRSLYDYLSQHPEIVDKLFGWAVAFLNRHLKRKLADLQEDERITFNYRNYLVKSTTFNCLKEEFEYDFQYSPPEILKVLPDL